MFLKLILPILSLLPIHSYASQCDQYEWYETLEHGQVQFIRSERGTSNRTNVNGVDRATFEVLKPGKSEGLECYLPFAADDEHVFYRGVLMPEISPVDFEPIKGPYAKTMDAVFFGPRPIEHADVETFEALSRSYGKDSQRVFFENIELEGADPRTFTVAADGFARDATYAYVRDSKYPLAEKRSFKYWYRIIGPRVFFQDIEIPGADAASFVELGREYAKDKNRVYFRQEYWRGRDAASFRVFEDGMSDGFYEVTADKLGVYISRVKVPNADPKLAKPVEPSKSLVREACYSGRSYCAVEGGKLHIMLIEKNDERRIRTLDMAKTTFLPDGVLVDGDKKYERGSRVE